MNLIQLIQYIKDMEVEYKWAGAEHKSVNQYSTQEEIDGLNRRKVMGMMHKRYTKEEKETCNNLAGLCSHFLIKLNEVRKEQ